MYRNITYSSKDYHCRYLDLDINCQHRKRPCGGKFGNFLEQSLGIMELPYDINLVHLVLEGVLTSDLFIEIPEDFFLKWKNYPETKATFETPLNDELKYAGFYNIDILAGNETKLIDFSHPYDFSHKKKFAIKFSTQIPAELKLVEHSNGRVFYPNEAYFSYWRSFILLESLEECKFIDRYLSEEKGISKFKQTVKKNNDRWNSKYSSAFERISHYKTFKTIFSLSDANIDCTYGEISNHLLNFTKSTTSDLESDLEKLLCLYKSWKRIYKNNGIRNFVHALHLLKRDIYFLFEWLCCAGFKERDLLKKWTYKNQQASSWSQLKDVLDFEEISFADTFERYVPFYSESITNWLSQTDISECYNRLKTFDSFSPWIRAFCDLHATINRKENINLIEPRVLDKLLVMTIRTEILIRAFYSQITGEQDPDLLRKLFGELANAIDNKKGQIILETISGSDSWKLTELRERPEDIFCKIMKSSVGKKWTKEQKYFFQSILNFVASRNYFAHHYYKDNELSERTNKLGAGVLTACLHTVLYIDRLISEKV